MHRLLIGVILGFTTVTLVGCGPSYEAQIRRQFLKGQHCPKYYIDVSWYNMRRIARVRGCGRFVHYAWIDSKYQDFDTRLRTRASFDMGCPVDRIKLTELGNWDERGVTG